MFCLNCGDLGLVDQGLKHLGDLLLSGSGGVESGPYLQEALIDSAERLADPAECVIEAGKTRVNLRSKIQRVRTQRVEAGGGRLTKVPELGLQLTHLAVRAASENSCRGRILLTGLHLAGQLPHLVFQRGNPRFEILGGHASSIVWTSHDDTSVAEQQ